MRMTIREASLFFGKSAHWVYANCYALQLRPAEWLLGASDVAEIIRRNFLSSSYEKYSYSALFSKRWSLVEKKATIVSIWSRVKSAEDACELVFAMKENSPSTSVANTVAYAKRVAGDRHFSFWEKFKDYSFTKLLTYYLKNPQYLDALSRLLLTEPKFLPGVEELTALRMAMKRFLK